MTNATLERSSDYKGAAVAAFAGALLSALVLAMALWVEPTEAQTCPPGEPDCNTPPTVRAHNASVVAGEGQTATNTGTYSDIGSGDVAIEASVGEVTKTGTNRGAWSWSMANAPLGRQQVIITATDGEGAYSTTRFTLTVTYANGPIAFASNRVTVTNPEGDSEIYTMNPDGTDIRQLTQNAAGDYTPAFSNCTGTNNFIAFGSDRDGNWEIYKMTTSGANQTRLTNNPFSDQNPSWSPDCAKIAFHSSRDGNWEVYIMDANGANPTRLTYRPEDDWNPSWSPDGSKIAFEGQRCPSCSGLDIYTINTNGANQTNITNLSAIYFAHDPAWSPDGSKIAFTLSRWEGNAEIYVMASNGANQTNITNNPAQDRRPSWSPDGTQIAFDSIVTFNNPEIYVMNANGANRTNLTNNQAPTGDASPSWGKVDIGYVP